MCCVVRNDEANITESCGFMKKKKVLVVGNEKAIAGMMVSLLTQAWFDVRFVALGHEGIDFISRLKSRLKGETCRIVSLDILLS